MAERTETVEIVGEDIYEIDLINKVTGVTYPGAYVYPDNTLRQIIEEYAEDLGIDPNDRKIIFENKTTNVSTSDLNETVEGLGLRNGDVLAVSDNAGFGGAGMNDELKVLLFIVLVVIGVFFWKNLRLSKTEKTVHPPLPPRERKAIVRTGPSDSFQHSPLRKSQEKVFDVRNNGMKTETKGPRGIKAYQFPCCPYDKQRNVVGKPQVIFWIPQKNCYRCSRGHEFRINGSPK